MSWKNDAACNRMVRDEVVRYVEGEAGTFPDVVRPWWWDTYRNGAPPQQDEAVKICGECPVWDECLDEAYEQGDGWTIRGGLFPGERDDGRLRSGGLRISDGHIQISAGDERVV